MAKGPQGPPLSGLPTEANAARNPYDNGMDQEIGNGNIVVHTKK
jgi:hypothetical protein